MKKNCIVYLGNNNESEIANLQKSLALTKKNLIKGEDTDILLFHEEGFPVSKFEGVIFKEIKFTLPSYNEDILKEIPEFFPHPTHQNGPIAYWHEGFTMGYRHMCRFFFLEVFEHIKEYETYMRLDSDSFVLSEVKYDIFDWFKSKDLVYSYIEEAVQLDNPLVCQGLNNAVFDWVNLNSISTLRNVSEIPNGMLYYTNFEMGKVSWFLNDKKSLAFGRFIDSTGKIFSARWGDHILRYLQINLFCDPEKVKPISGFHYKHGATYNT